MTKYSRKYRKIYRVEKADNPSVGGFSAPETRSGMNHYLPEPRYDADWPEDRSVYSGEYFGAPTKRAMKRWIVDAKKLSSFGMVVRHYRVQSEYVVASKIQCVFPLDKAEKVGEYNVVEFVK